MADPLAEKLAQVLFGSTDLDKITTRNLRGSCTINMVSPGPFAKFVIGAGVKVTASIETTCCECPHTLILLDSDNHEVGRCTPTIACASGTTGNGTGECTIPLPTHAGFYHFEVEYCTGKHQTLNTIEVITPGFFGWLKWIFRF